MFFAFKSAESACIAHRKRDPVLFNRIKEDYEYTYNIYMYIYFERSSNFHVGGKPDGIFGPDPLLVHYREENERLQNANEELAEKVCNLEESLAERDCCDDPCEKVKYMREKIAALRDRFTAEKKRYYC